MQAGERLLARDCASGRRERTHPLGEVSRRNRRLTRAATAATALSFLDVVSAGFGAAVFLFVVFASFPIDAPPPMTGGGGRFIDVRIEWRKLTTDGGLTQSNEPFREQLADEVWADAIMEALMRKIYEEYIKQQLDEELAKLILRSEAEAEVRKLLEPYQEYMTAWDEAIGRTLPGMPNYEKFMELCGAVNVVELMKMGRKVITRNIEIKCEFNRLNDEGDLIEEILEFEKVNEEQKERAKQSIGAGEPVVNLHIIHTDHAGQINVTRLTELRIDSSTDFVESKNADLPWKFFQIIGFDHFGRYLTLAKRTEMNVMFLRILGPQGGKWQFRANLFSGGGYLNERHVGKVEAIISVKCSSNNEFSKKIDFDIGNNKPIPVNDNSPCEFSTDK